MKKVTRNILLGLSTLLSCVAFSATQSVEKKVEVKAAPVPAPAPTPPKAEAPKVETPAPASKQYDSKDYWGQPIYENGKLKHVEENKSQTHSKENFVWVKVKNIKKDPAVRNVGRIRIAVWNNKDTFAVEGVRPFRACSHWAKEIVGDEMTFKIGGLTPGESYSFFAHFDETNAGKIVRNWIGIPVDQYIFTDKKTQGIGAGKKREGIRPPAFENTLVKFTKPGQVVELNF